jgi:hypothetical protein
MREWLSDRRKELEKKFYQSLRQRYEIEITMPGSDTTLSQDEVDSMVDAQ